MLGFDAPAPLHELPPAFRVEGNLIADEREGHPVRPVTQGAGDDARGLASSGELVCVPSEVLVTLAQRPSELDDRFAELRLALPGDRGVRASLARGFVEPRDEPGHPIDLRRGAEP